jgi:outer membrane lipoprotein-sorting protein
VRKSGLIRKIVIVVLTFILTGALGCGGGGLKAVDFSGLPVLSASPEDLISRINRDGGSIPLMKGKLGMGLQRGPGEKVKRCSGMLLARNSTRQGIYLKGYKRLIPTFFTMVSDGSEFWFHIPRDDVVYTGPVDFAWSEDDSVELYLNARDLFRALFVAPIEPDAAFEVLETGGEYSVSVYDGAAAARKVWVERKRFTVVRELYYDNNGLEQLEIERREWVDVEGHLYPSSLVLRDLVSGSSVYLEFNSITVNPENVPDNVFRFTAPSGARIEQVDDRRERA